jgi:hypothetical protein
MICIMRALKKTDHDFVEDEVVNKEIKNIFRYTK